MGSCHVLYRRLGGTRSFNARNALDPRLFRVVCRVTLSDPAILPFHSYVFIYMRAIDLMEELEMN